jgi:phosphoenolpyruvate-protein kinase (PTS system EI component)
VIDGDAGVVIVDPTAAAIDEYRAIMRKRETAGRVLAVCATSGADARRRARRAARQTSSSLAMPPRRSLRCGGIGLFRSEFLFMNATASCRAKTSSTRRTGRSSRACVAGR